MEHNLSGIPETLLIALWARAAETVSPDPLIRDDKAVEMVSAIDYDFTRFEEKSKLTRTGVAVRTMLLDQALSRLIKEHPDAVVINFGAGLDTRHARLGCGDVDWYEIDLPEAISLRRRFFDQTDHYRFIDGSMFDLSWADQVETGGRPVIFLAEGLFMYFEEEKLRPLFAFLADGFSGGRMLIEVLAPTMVGRSKKHETVKKIDSQAEFKWGVKNPKDLEAWHPGIRLLNTWDYNDYCKKRWGLFGVIARLPLVRPWLSCRILELGLGT